VLDYLVCNITKAVLISAIAVFNMKQLSGISNADVN
jgi:hypothetical protein